MEKGHSEERSEQNSEQLKKFLESSEEAFPSTEVARSPSEFLEETVGTILGRAAQTGQWRKTWNKPRADTVF